MSCTCPPPVCAPITAPWTPAGFVSIAATPVSANVELSMTGVGLTLLVENLGPDIAYVAFGDNTVLATTSSTPIQSGEALVFPQGTNTYAAAITASGETATVNFTSGSGTPSVINGQVVAVDAAVLGVLTETGTFTSGTFAAIGTSQTLFPAAQPSRRLRVVVRNTDVVTTSGGTGVAVWLRWGTTAAAVRGSDCFPLLAGSAIDNADYPNQGALQVIAESGGTPAIYWELYTT